MDQINVDQVDLGDNEFIRLGNSQDLTLVHDASNSIINQAGIGDLLIQKAGSTKLTVNSTGIDVTGTVTADGLTVDGGGSFTMTGGGLKVFNNGTAGYNANIFFGLPNQTDGWSIGQGITANDGVFRLYDNGGAGVKMSATTGGDISFYEDTGTTAKLFWDASAERLGIGTSSPDRPLDITDTTSDGSGGLVIHSYLPTLEMDDISGGGTSFILQHDGTSTLFKHDTSEAMRISGGNLLVGTTVTNPYTSATEVGAVVRGDEGILGASRDGGPSLRVNRIGTGGTENGDIAEFRSNGTTVGSIGSATKASVSRLMIGTGETNLYFFDTDNTIYPVNSNGTDSDADTDLGASGVRFKDLYLSGGVDISQGAAPQTAFIDFTKTINDDAVFSFTPDKPIGVLYIYGRNNSYKSIVGMVSWRSLSTAFCQQLLDPYIRRKNLH
jgi:hypothetical protein